MGGLRCAKEIIDNGFRLNAAMGCMNTTILLHPDNEPSYEERDEFLAASEALAKVCAKIEKRIASGRPYEG